jgi:L-serine dehydratase
MTHDPAHKSGALRSAVSVFDLFTVGIGPSSSHTIGPMRAARTFVTDLDRAGRLSSVEQVIVELFGSLAATSRGHGSDRAVLLGLAGEAPEEVDPGTLELRLSEIRSSASLRLLGRHAVPYVEPDHLRLDVRPLPFHPNGRRRAAMRPRCRPRSSERSRRGSRQGR